MHLRKDELPKYRYNPITKKIEKTERKKKIRNREKSTRNIRGATPGYIFKINEQDYICMDSTDIPRPLNPIPVRVYPKPERTTYNY